MASSSDNEMQSASDDQRPQRGNAPGGRGRERWEDIQRSWDLVTEGADGSLSGTVEGLLEAGKRKRILRDTTPLQRGIIRHLALILDLSISMTEKDLRPTRYLLTLRYATQFINAFFSQNPISQLCIIGMRDGIAIRISDMSGNPSTHIEALKKLLSQSPSGVPSLQNALNMSRAALFHSPSHGTREVLIVFGALLSSDPDDIHATIRRLVTDSIRVNVVGLAARVAICTELCAATNGVSRENTDVYGVAMNEAHFRELLMQYTTPPVTRVTGADGQARLAANLPTLLHMGFPNRDTDLRPTLCACHSALTKLGFVCPRCSVKVCSLPAQCPGCDLQLIQSPHLARSYHHLFPLRNFVEVSWADARVRLAEGGRGCFGCLERFPVPPTQDAANGHVDDEVGPSRVGRLGADAPPARPASSRLRGPGAKRMQKGASESSRYMCTTCGAHFCIDCDVLAHETLHNCGGCLAGFKGGRRGDASGEIDGVVGGEGVMGVG